MRLSFLVKFFVLSLLLGAAGNAGIKEVRTMKEVMEAFKDDDLYTLAIFDVDMVLVQPSDPAFQMANMKRYSHQAKRITQTVPQEKRHLFLTLMAIQSDMVLIDEKMPSYFIDLYNKEVYAIGLTANLTGKFAHIKNLEQWKSNALKNLGLDFYPLTPYETDLKFTDLPSYRGNYSAYCNGILFANGNVCPKGDVLVNFLKVAKHYPQKIVFVDDRRENLENVEDSLQRHFPYIQYEGLHYLGACDYPSAFIEEKEFIEKWEALAEQARDVE